MDLLSIVILSFSFIFTVLYLWRVRKRSFSTSSIVLSIEEGELQVLDQYGTPTFYYPIIQYKYEINNKKYTGNTARKDARRYRVQDVDFYGMENTDDKFFWRSLKKDDTIDIEVNKWNYNDSWLSLGETDTHKSETKMFLAAATLFLLIFIFLKSI